jgi:hypothetical protein
MPAANLRLAQRVADTYSATPAGLVLDAAPDRVVISQLDSATVVAIRGTDNLAGWWSDFQVQPRLSRTHPQLGTCEDGFLTGAETVWSLIQPHLTSTPIILTGHSRGAAIVPILAGLMQLANVAVSGCVCFEKPWCCDDVLPTLIGAIAGMEYWNGNDPVPSQPSVPWLIGNVWPITRIGVAQLVGLECHMMDSVLAALAGTP